MFSLPLRPAAALLSRKVLAQNLKRIQREVKTQTQLHRPDARVMAMVKADAYGHDLSLILPELWKIGVRDFAVASLSEGIQARELSSKARILILGGTFDWRKVSLDVLRKNQFEVAVNDLASLKILLTRPDIPFHLKLDTGMNRLGLKPDQWEQAIGMLRRAKRKPNGLFMHFAMSTGSSYRNQVMLFEEAVRWFWTSGCDAEWVHSENSGALFTSEKVEKGLVSQVGNLCRPGISLYGYTSRDLKPIQGISPVLELVSEIGLVKNVEKGEGISYGHLYRANKSHRYGVVPLGYADGISKMYANLMEPEWRSRSGKRKGSLKVCGAICMDMVMVRAERGEIKPHDRVAFWGRFPNPMLQERLVEPYELNLRLAKRLPRLWVD